MLTELSAKQSVTVFMSSHILGEVSRLAKRIGITHQGRLVQEIDVAELERTRQRRLLLRARHLQAIHAALLEAGYSALVADRAVEVRDPDAIERPDDVASLLVGAGQPPTMLVVEQEDIEDHFLRLIGMDGGEIG